jgi:hypothetical protein
MEVTNEIKKICKVCGSSENKFQPTRLVCAKCVSKKNNKQLKEKNYYKDYFKQNKKEILLKQKDNQKKYYQEHREEILVNQKKLEKNQS